MPSQDRLSRWQFFHRETDVEVFVRLNAGCIDNNINLITSGELPNNESNCLVGEPRRVINTGPLNQCSVDSDTGAGTARSSLRVCPLKVSCGVNHQHVDTIRASFRYGDLIRRSHSKRIKLAGDK